MPRPILKLLNAVQVFPPTVLKPAQEQSCITPTSLPIPVPTGRGRLLLTPHVHFPPTPVLYSIHEAYSPGSYDRAPIPVSPNAGALVLPNRGDRVYSLTMARPLREPKSVYIHAHTADASDHEQNADFDD